MSKDTVTQEAGHPSGDQHLEGPATEAVNSGEPATGSESGKAEKVFTQADVDRLIQARLAEEKARLQKRYEKELEAKLAEKDKELDKLVEERLAAVLKAKELEAAREQVVKEYGLTERQAAVLTGETAEELRTAAEELFGALKKQPPIVPTGGNPPAGGGTTGVFTRSQLRDPKFFAANRAEIMRALSEGRIVED